MLFEEDESFELIPGTMRGMVGSGFSRSRFLLKREFGVYFFSLSMDEHRKSGALEGFLFSGRGGWPNDEASTSFVTQVRGSAQRLGWSCDVSLVRFRPIQSFPTGGKRNFVSVEG